MGLGGNLLFALWAIELFITLDILGGIRWLLNRSGRSPNL
jgi:hypothetical protein